MSSELNDIGHVSEAPTPPRRAKKRVGWHTSSSSAGGESSDGMLSFAAPIAQPQIVEPHAQTPQYQRSPLASPQPSPSLSPEGAPDARELSIALTKVLSEEKARRDEQFASHLAPAEDVVSIPRAPRPALRRNTSYDAPEERHMADQAEQKASQRQLRSMTDARQRADRLASSLGSYSAPGSRRNSDELHAPFQPLMGDSDDRDPPRHDTANVLGRKEWHHHVRHRVPHARQHGWQESAMESDDEAETPIDSHTSKVSSRDFFLHDTSPSGTSTPIQHQQQYPEDYVPRPKKYRGGILSSLLKLYSDDRGLSGSGSGGTNTPLSPGTPIMSPGPSPPSSRPASTIGIPRARPNSGLFNYQRSRHSTSSLALTELMKSSSMFTTPGSASISGQWAEKIKREKPPPKQKKEQIRITVHIAGIISRHRYLLKLCRALMMYGAPTHRLEEYMSMSSRVLEIEGQFLYIPSCMIISFDDSTTHTTEVKIVRVPQGIDLGRLRDVHNIYKDVVHDKLGVEEATKRLEDVMSRTPKFPTWFRVPMYGIASVCVAPFAFEGRFIDLPVAFLLGCLVGLLQLVFAPSNELYAHVFEVTAAVITSFLARGFGSIRNGELFCFSALAQSSIALILPGYIVLCSSLELQSHNIVSGSVRMVYAMIYTLFLGYGITIGASLYGMMDSNATSATHCTAPLHRGWFFMFVPGFAMCLCIINQAKWKQTPVMVVMALAGYCVNSYCSKYFEGNTQISNMLGALTVGILANLYSRVGRHVHNAWWDFVEWYQYRLRPRFTRTKLKSDRWSSSSISDTESIAGAPPPQRQPRKVGYSLAAAAMLPAIFVQVPSGLAAGGSLLAGITSANQINGGNGTSVNAGASTIGNLDGTAFNVLFSVIQVAIGISVGLFMSALIVYPLGKRRSGLFSF